MKAPACPSDGVQSSSQPIFQWRSQRRHVGPFELLQLQTELTRRAQRPQREGFQEELGRPMLDSSAPRGSVRLAVTRINGTLAVEGSRRTRISSSTPSMVPIFQSLTTKSNRHSFRYSSATNPSSAATI